MSRVKSSTKLFIVQNKDNSFESESASDLSTGDGAYPILAFRQRTIKEFEPKVTINYINNKQTSILRRMSRVPTFAKLRYEPPMKSKDVYSPPQSSSFEK